MINIVLVTEVNKGNKIEDAISLGECSFIWHQKTSYTFKIRLIIRQNVSCTSKFGQQQHFNIISVIQYQMEQIQLVKVIQK